MQWFARWIESNRIGLYCRYLVVMEHNLRKRNPLDYFSPISTSNGQESPPLCRFIYTQTCPFFFVLFVFGWDLLVLLIVRFFMVGGSNSWRFKDLPSCTQQVVGLIPWLVCQIYKNFFSLDNQIYKNLETTFMWVF